MLLRAAKFLSADLTVRFNDAEYHIDNVQVQPFNNSAWFILHLSRSGKKSKITLLEDDLVEIVAALKDPSAPPDF